MKAIITFLAIVMSLTGYTQTVSTFLNSPTANVNDALAFDSKGNLYGSDFIGTSVYKINPSGNATVFVTGLQNPNGLAFDSHDNLYVCEYSGAAIRKYNKDGVLLNTYPVNGPPSGLIRAHGGNNMIFTIADFGNPANNSLNELSSNGTITTIYQGAPLNIPVGLTYSPGGDPYVGNYLDRTIYRMRNNSNFLDYIATVPDAGTNAPYLAFIAYSKGSLNGTMLKQFTKVKSGAGLVVSELKAGLYLITIETEDGLATQKFVKN